MLLGMVSLAAVLLFSQRVRRCGLDRCIRLKQYERVEQLDEWRVEGYERWVFFLKHILLLLVRESAKGKEGHA